MDYSIPVVTTPIATEWQNSPIVRAVTEKNPAGKLVCPFSNCAKQYVSTLQLGKHLMKDHYKDLSMRDKTEVIEMTSTPHRRSKGVGSSSPSFPVTPVKVRFSTGKAQSRGMTKRKSTDAGISPAQTRSKTRKMFKPDADSVKKIFFPGKYPKL